MSAIANVCRVIGTPSGPTGIGGSIANAAMRAAKTAMSAMSPARLAGLSEVDAAEAGVDDACVMSSPWVGSGPGPTRADPTLTEHRSGVVGGAQFAARLLGLLTGAHSHSMVPGGFEVTSRTTRLMSSTSLVIRFEMTESVS